MKLIGSRASKSSDAFSDWDYQIEHVTDFDEVRDRLKDALVWKSAERGPVHILTLVDNAGILWDFSSVGDLFARKWRELSRAEHKPQISEYWIMSFKHLKALYRGKDILLDVGIELSAALARDIYLDCKFGIKQYKDFFAFGAVEHDLMSESNLSRITGLPYATRTEKVTKISALNDLVSSVAGRTSETAKNVFSQRLALLDDLHAEAP